MSIYKTLSHVRVSAEKFRYSVLDTLNDMNLLKFADIKSSWTEKLIMTCPLNL